MFGPSPLQTISYHISERLFFQYPIIFQGVAYIFHSVIRELLVADDTTQTISTYAIEKTALEHILVVQQVHFAWNGNKNSTEKKNERIGNDKFSTKHDIHE